MLEGVAAACANDQAVLCIVVVNCSSGRKAAELERTHYLLRTLSSGAKALSLPGIFLTQWPGIGDLVVIDRASEGRQLPKNQGVGLARKIGFDLALAWHYQGVIESPWIHTTDADATLPAEYFNVASQLARADIAGLSYPFRHETVTASSAGRALELYESSLRYYVLGLAWADSPYAFHSIGSTMAVKADAYLAVRGMPKRQAGEDFYLLNKVAKIARIARPQCPPIQLRQRLSARTPFGTGPATRKIVDGLLRGEDFKVYHPKSFALLREWLAAMNEFAENCDLGILDRFSHDELADSLANLNAKAHLEECLRQAKSRSAREKRLNDWFDGFRTLKLIHGLRDAGLADLPWQQAYDAAPFVPEPEAGQHYCQAMERHEAKALA